VTKDIFGIYYYLEIGFQPSFGQLILNLDIRMPDSTDYQINRTLARKIVKVWDCENIGLSIVNRQIVRLSMINLSIVRLSIVKLSIVRFVNCQTC